MKLPVRVAVCLTAWSLALGARFRSKTSERSHAAMEVATGTGLREQVGLMVREMFRHKDTTARHIASKAHKKMRFEDAVPKIAGKLPKDVLSLVNMVSGHKGERKTKRTFSEESLAKARVYLNNMMYDAWLELDQVEVECKEFEESNREVFSQIVTDLEHLGSDLADSYRMKTEAEGKKQDMDTKMTEAKAVQHQIKRDFRTTRERNSLELSLRTDDQDVFDAILSLSTCPNTDDNTYNLAQFAVCEDADGKRTIVTNNTALLAKIKRSPRAERSLIAVLDTVHGDSSGRAAPSLVQLDRKGKTQQAPQKEKTLESNGRWEQCKYASDEDVNCGLLHDTMAQEWGKYKDLVDELTYTMERNHDMYVKESDNINEVITTLRNNVVKFQEMLSEATSEINSLEAAKREKQNQHRDIEKAFELKMNDCHERVIDILFTNICGTRTVRNGLMESSTVSPPSAITDCDVTDWSAGPCTVDGRAVALAVDCDDNCPKDVGGIDVSVCGGMKFLTRQVVESPNAYGMSCPPLFFQSKNGTDGMKCNQFLCPVACELSEWSGYSECSKECGGGTQGKTRAILIKAKNGGQECDTTLEDQPCNTGSCDRDCTLQPWTEWEPCSMACGGGLQKRTRAVDVPIRANGKCPEPDHPTRQEIMQCNTQDCVGDEICIARQDLVIAVDGSGSVEEDGFEIIKKLTYNFTSNYQNEYYGVEDMRIGLVLFGNGVYNEGNGTVSAAIEVQSITSDLDTLRSKILTMEWQRGFTNMMQAFTAADRMFAEGRDDAQAAVLMISDGKYTNAYRTGMKAQELKDKGVQIFMAPISEFNSPGLKLIRKWASQPWETNYERLPGIDGITANEDLFAQRMLVKFCPRAFSPSQRLAEEQAVGFLKIKEDAYPSDSCGQWVYLGTRDSDESCMESVKDRGYLAFSYEDGGYWHGSCYLEAITVDADFWAEALNSRVNLNCPNGDWTYNQHANTYILNPSMFGDLFDTAATTTLAVGAMR
jgi:hypothetical protein